MELYEARPANARPSWRAPCPSLGCKTRRFGPFPPLFSPADCAAVVRWCRNRFASAELSSREQADPFGMDSSTRPPYLRLALLRGSVTDGSESRGWVTLTLHGPWRHYSVLTIDRVPVITSKLKASLVNMNPSMPGGGKHATWKAYSNTRPYTAQGADSKDVTGRLSRSAVKGGYLSTFLSIVSSR